MNVVVTGSRDFDAEDVLDAIIEGLREHPTCPPLRIAHGACPTGADAFVAAWHLDPPFGDIEITPYPAQWDRLGKAAGPARNKLMLKESDPDLVLAFFKRGAKNRGTQNCVDQAREMNYRVVEVWA